MQKTLAELAEYLGGRVIGDPSATVKGLASLDDASEGYITFLANPRYAAKVATTRATAVVLPEGADGHGHNVIEVANPYLAFAKLLTLFHVRREEPKGIMAGANVGSDVQTGADVSIYPGATVMEGARIGDRVVIFPGAVIYGGVQIGDDVTIHANVTVRERCRIGSRVIIHAGTVIGNDGFGYAPDGNSWYKIPQVGIVVIEDDVEIGANCTIDRAALEVTRIGRGTKIDNLVQVAHNCIVGSDCMIVAQVGIAGSTRLGNHVTLAGQVAVNGHIEIGDDVIVAGKSGVTKSFAAGSRIGGFPAHDQREWLKSVVILPQLPELKKGLKTLEQRIAELEKALQNQQTQDV